MMSGFDLQAKLLGRECNNLAMSIQKAIPEAVQVRFPKSSCYDLTWIVKNQMGPNPLWLTEFLCETLTLEPGMRVLDLACGKALSSIFLAQNFDVQVWAADLWITASDNALRIQEADLDQRVFPLRLNARELPFADGFFDAVISIDAFEYFGTDDLFLSSLIPLLKPGGQLGIVNAGLIHEVDELPSSWPSEFCALHSAAWWRRHWNITGLVDVETADDMPGGRKLWLHWDDLLGVTDNMFLRSKDGESLTFNRIVARRKTEPKQG